MQIDVDTTDLDRVAQHLRLVGLRVSGYAHLASRRAAVVAADFGDETGAALHDTALEFERAIEALATSYRHYGDSVDHLAVHYSELDATVFDPDVRR